MFFSPLKVGNSMKLKSFLDKYDTVIFDLDGVITSENAYWDSAAATVYERIFKDKFSPREIEENIGDIRKEVFSDDLLIAVLKNKGVNSNWDLAYITLGVLNALDTEDFSEVLEYAKKLPDDVFEIFKIIAGNFEKKLGLGDYSRKSKFWEDLKMAFQEWFLGDEIFKETYGLEVSRKGKSGFISKDKPVVDLNGLKEVFSQLKGKRLAVATGRPYIEAKTPLEEFGIFDFFSKDGFITFDDVLRVQKELGVEVTKPHPYMFQKAMLGSGFPDKNILEGSFKKDLISKTLIVGDAGSDILGAKAMGADFLAVLTGVNGKEAKGYFEEQKSTYILDSILDFIEK